MRTTGEATVSAPATARSAPPRRRSRVEGPADTAPESPPQPAAAEPAAVAVAAVRMVRVDEGLYALRVGELTGAVSEVGGMVVPVAQVSAPFAEDGNGIEIVASFPRRGSWIERTGGTQILRSPAGGGYVVVTVYADAQAQHTSPTIDLQRLDGPVGAFEQAAGIAAGSAPATAPALPGRATCQPRFSFISSGPATACSPAAAGSAHSAAACGSKPSASARWSGSPRPKSR